MAGLTLIKYVYDLSDEAVCARFVDSPYIQSLRVVFPTACGVIIEDERIYT